MPSPATTTEFTDLVRRSGVVEGERLDSYLEELRRAENFASEPTRLAGQLVSDGLITLFQAEQILQGKWRGFAIGKYRVLERLGSGAMGQVFLCQHKVMNRRVAMKVLPTGKADDATALERFYREARALASLDHPNLARAYDIDQDNAVHFLVLEYVDGSSLQEIVKRTGPLDALRACHYIHQAALGLEYAFQTAGLVHRDIKPGNILVDRAGVVKILDMGLARFFHEEGESVTQPGQASILGTADYVSPEQAINGHAADIRSDIYSLGATFYCLLAGSPPFPDGSVAQKLIAHQMREPKPIGELRPDVSEEICAIVEKMMRKDPAVRYQTPAEIAEALAPFTQTPIPAPPIEEMPDLSLAAQGSGKSPAAWARLTPRNPNDIANQKNRTPLSVPRRTMTVSPKSSGIIGGVDQPVSGDSGSRGSGILAGNPFAGIRPGSSARIVSPTERAELESVYITGSGSQRFEPAPRTGVHPRAALMYFLAGGLAFALGTGVFIYALKMFR